LPNVITSLPGRILDLTVKLFSPFTREGNKFTSKATGMSWASNSAPTNASDKQAWSDYASKAVPYTVGVVALVETVLLIAAVIIIGLCMKATGGIGPFGTLLKSALKR
jgi:hypothetical protein